MKYLLEDGSGVVEAATATDLVAQLKGDGRFTADQTNEEYMRDFAIRFREFYGGNVIRNDTPENFIADLVREGWLSEVPE
ncbi:hypothetical protein [Arsenicibacter rosenii]|uniref:Uncharacterized protein n=1 Tax=Arsenicibacter rosenii TaxID=1750698 RepID=A0A1S2VBD9_9BACT|nr:hypothetical protein [Arsenicibacter rosenii]OIN55625.1 hypothetical protein BLX24_29005 [Arsenicibacter rosenii]